MVRSVTYALLAGALFGASSSLAFWLAGGLMGWGVWLRLTEHHEHGRRGMMHVPPHFPNLHHRHSH